MITRPLAFLLLAAGLAACGPDWGEPNNFRVETEYRPVFLRRADLEQSIRLETARDLSDPAKIYHKDGYLLISERYEGVHLIDNRDPAQPKQLGFLRVPGCVDIAMRGRTLYADNGVDLVAVDLQDFTQPREVSRVRRAFPTLLPPDGGAIPETFETYTDEDLVIVGWTR
ncbi:MAG: hypothetical protein WBA12_09245 [Catalinimonas sp.]